MWEEIIVLLKRSYLKVLVLPQHLDPLQSVNVTVARHPQVAVPRQSLSVYYLQLLVALLLPVLEQSRSHRGVQYCRLQNSGKNQIGSHCLGYPSQDFLLLGSSVVLAVSFPIRVFSSFFLIFYLLLGSLFLLCFEFFLELFYQIDLLLIGLSQSSFNFLFVSDR